ncbi:hypothetical protein R3P38DRAFT_3356945 [Favolaschia claudopus]|uniref:F-box domain-containing protein n=1 Tax=Favolaschia claudopus TaxID=2862362 RepID=A0AAW0BAE2_9AGAR
MAVLLDLSPELVTAILDHLVPFLQTLDNLYLAGNHNLFTLARPYTWREVDITLSDNRQTSAALAERLLAFCADSAKVSAVRSLNITFTGFFDYHTPAIKTLGENLWRFTNLTHVTINCVNNTANFWTQPRYIQSIIEDLPALLSLTIDGCIDTYCKADESLASLAALRIPPLKHLAARFCEVDDGVSQIWCYCSNLEVVELAGGLAERFFKENSSLPLNGIRAKMDGTSEYSAGMYHILNPPRNAPGRPAIFHHAKTIKVISDDANASTVDSDCWGLTNFFEDHPDEPSETLTEIFLELSIDVYSFSVFLTGIRSAILERVGVVALGGVWIPSKFDEFLVELTHTGGLFFDGFESLEELVLPCDGISPETLRLLPRLLAHAPTLQHLYFAVADCEDGDLAVAAQTYAEAISTLASVSWRNRCCFNVSLPAGISPVRLRERPYQAPRWQGWNGIGEWWEI